MKASKNCSNLNYLTKHFQFSVWLCICSLLIPLVIAFASSFNQYSSPELLVFPDKSLKGPSCLHDSFLILVFLQTFHTFFSGKLLLSGSNSRLWSAQWALSQLSIPSKAHLPFEKNKIQWEIMPVSLFVRIFCTCFSCVGSLFWLCWGPKSHFWWSLWRERILLSHSGVLELSLMNVCYCQNLSQNIWSQNT